MPLAKAQTLEQQAGMQPTAHTRNQRGFTLVELAIVLVIIGLIVGGVLVGQDLITASETSATISQIGKYDTAVSTFRLKYNALPGDITASAASSFGFVARGLYKGEGDGNGILEGVASNAANQNGGGIVNTGEPATFWVDLSTANLIEGNFNTGSSTVPPAADVTGGDLELYFPKAKLGRGNLIYAWSGGWSQANSVNDGKNYYSIAAMQTLKPGGYNPMSNTTIPVFQAFNIDQKIDDGLPQSGRVMAMFNERYGFWPQRPSYWGGPYTTATAGSVATCVDNGNVAGVAQRYSMGQNGGAGQNCALSFQFQ